jgi:hypothetical protein
MLVTAAPALADTSVPTVSATPASPGAACPSVSSSPLMGALNDFSSYAPVAGGTFEDDAAGWSLNGASVVSGNEPWSVVNATDSNSLAINGGGSATSPTFCVDNTFPSFRFFADSNGGGWRSGLTVSARWTLSSGQNGQSTITALSSSDYGSWEPTPALALGSVLAPGQTVTVRFVFSAGSGPGWNIDDVLLDPYAK